MAHQTLPAASAPIARISIDKLFGYLSYEIELPGAGEDSKRALILYGENGSGKTTILRSIYSMLSGANNRGHRTRLGRTPFRQIVVTFADGRRVGALRNGTDGTDAGSYAFWIQDSNGRRSSTEWSPSQHSAHDYRVLETADGEIRLVHGSPVGSSPGANRPTRVPEFDHQIERLRQVVPEAVYFLRDDRSLGSDELPSDDDIEEYQRRRFMEEGRPPSIDQRTLALENALRRARAWVQESTLRASEIGGQSTNQIYIDVASRIASPSRSDDPSSMTTAPQMRERLINLGRRTESFNRLGLVAEAPSQQLVNSLESVPTDRNDALLSVLVPYADSLEAQLNALEDLRFALTTFLDQAEGFLTNKHIMFSVRHGIQVISPSGEPLQPEQLSSGERQLLVLLITVLSTRDAPALYLIDEPELSLNMKWQRRLVDSLLACSGGSNASFIMASHSFELMAAARESVFNLSDS